MPDDVFDHTWSILYRVGGAAALIMLILIPIGAIPFIVSPRPDTVNGWFTLIEGNRLLGIALLDAPNLVVNIVGIMLFLALYAALRRVDESLSTIAAVLGVVASTLYIVSNPAFAMLSLSGQYAAATTEAQRSVLLAAGQTVITVYQSSTAFVVSYVFGAIATLIFSAVMVRGNIFSKRAAYAGIFASIFTLGLFVPEIGLYVSILSLVPYAVWLALVARRLLRLGAGI
ncbi:MAG: hypothetical protein NTV61_00040 [Candidatus Bathyarchaeota archaeon]|nr:hypothetical protein [Candidatus Bathyarchaeota archaeon]